MHTHTQICTESGHSPSLIPIYPPTLDLGGGDRRMTVLTAAELFVRDDAHVRESCVLE